MRDVQKALIGLLNVQNILVRFRDRTATLKVDICLITLSGYRSVFRTRNRRIILLSIKVSLRRVKSVKIVLKSFIQSWEEVRMSLQFDFVAILGKIVTN